jgi:uncharacterized protein (DUF1501 family)
MNRRNFIKNGVKACAGAILTQQYFAQQQAFANLNLFNAVQGSCSENILVMVQLFGGNDGLNTFIPIDQLSTMSSVRSNVMITEANLKFATAVNAGNATLGTRSSVTTKYADMAFHPAMEGAYNLFEANKMSLVMSCSYDNPDYSHFRGTDIVMMGADSDEFLKSGWVGRSLEEQYKWDGFPDPATLLQNGYPDPLCINMGSIAPLAFNASTGVGAGVAVTSITNDYPLLGGFGDLAPPSCAGEELAFIRKVAIDTDKYNSKIVAAANVQKTNMSTLYGSDSLSNDLKKVARLIKGGMKTKVYMVYLGGFDTHTNQVGSATYSGNHTTLLNNVSKAIAGFQDDLEKMGVADKVTGMVFSEFGRTVRSNGGKGTDHGRSAPVWLFGNSLKGGRYGTNPKLKDANNNTVAQVPMQYDYRSVYYSVLKDWFGLSQVQLESVFGGATKTAKYAAQYHDLFIPSRKVAACNITGTEEETEVISTGSALNFELFPNPMDENSSTLSFKSYGGNVRIELFDKKGTLLRTVFNNDLIEGKQEVNLERGDLKQGMYLVRIYNGKYSEARKLVIM